MNMFIEFKKVLSNKYFVYLWFSQVLSLTTINIMNFVLLITIFQRTGSSIATSLIWVAYALPAILVGPFAAVVVDFVDKRKLLIIANLLQAVLIFLYALSHNPTFFFAYGLIFIYSLLNQFYVPSESASLPTLLPKNQYVSANSMFFLTSQAALVVGFAFAGVILHFLGFDRTLYICSLLLFLAFLSVTFLPPLKAHKKRDIFELGVADYFSNIWQGYVFIKKNRFVLAPLILLLSFSAALAVAMVNVPAFVNNILGISLNLAGLYVVAPAGLGALIGASILPKMLKSDLRKKKIIEISLFTLSLMLLLLTFAIPEFNGLIKTVLSIVITMLMGFSAVGIIVPSQTFLQLSTPKEFRGRVFGNYAFLSTIVTIFPVIFSGTIAEVFGVKILYFFLGVLSFAGLIFSKKYGDKFLNHG
jgi:MFS family permease